MNSVSEFHSQQVPLSSSHDRLDLLGVKVSAVNIALATAIIDSWIIRKIKTYVCVAPVSTLVDCQKNSEYREIVNQAGMVTPDGMPVVWLGKMSGNQLMSRTYGPDLMSAVCDAGQSKGHRHFLYGANQATLNQLQEVLNKKYPKIQIVGMYAPEFVAHAQLESNETIHRINDSGADILWIGLGSPKQDYWMKLHRSKLNVPVMIAVGAAFDFLSGKKAQAPRWMQRCGLEWVFRLCHEPKRLWRRYLIGNSEFIFYVIRDCWRKCFLTSTSSSES